jgi:hypothetical protein
MDAAAQAAAQAATNRRLKDTILDLPEFNGSSKDTITTDNLMNVAKGNVQQNLKMATVEVPINRGQNKPTGDNQMHNQGKHTCWYCNIPGHRQEECRKRIKDGKPCTELDGSTYWPKPKQIPMDEEKEGEGKGESEIIQGAMGEMYTGHLANVFSGFQ